MDLYCFHTSILFRISTTTTTANTLPVVSFIIASSSGDQVCTEMVLDPEQDSYEVHRSAIEREFKVLLS
jgi:hypothetical protein